MDTLLWLTTSLLAVSGSVLAYSGRYGRDRPAAAYGATRYGGPAAPGGGAQELGGGWLLLPASSVAPVASSDVQMVSGSSDEVLFARPAPDGGYRYRPRRAPPRRRPPPPRPRPAPLIIRIHKHRIIRD